MTWRQFKRWLVGIGSALLALAAAALIVFETLLQMNIYKDPKWIPLTIVGVVAVGTLATNIRSTINVVTASEREKTRLRIYQACVAAAAVTSNHTGVDVLTIGVSAYKTVRRPGFCKRLWPLTIKVKLGRVARCRVADLPQPSNVRWTKGKGAIGTCLQSEHWQHKNWSPIVALFPSGTPTEAQFGALTDDDRAGLTYKEFVRIYDKYAEILAVPIMSVGGSQIVGVVAVDRPYDASHATPVLDSPSVLAAAETAAVAICTDVGSAPILDP